MKKPDMQKLDLENISVQKYDLYTWPCGDEDASKILLFANFPSAQNLLRTKKLKEK